MGGAVGLKGTDGEGTLRRALALGATNVSAGRAREFLCALGRVSNAIDFWTCPGTMGEEIMQGLGITCKVIQGRRGSTVAQDTRSAASIMEGCGVDIIAFCGGDGTARDILNTVGERVPVIGIPSGVKMHSGVFATTPQAAAVVIMKFLWGELPLEEAEVADVDEEAFREGRVSSKLYGYLLVPYEPSALQGMKEPSPLTDEVCRHREALAKWIVERMDGSVTYILGPGGTVKAVNELMGIDSTLLGVDLVRDGELVKGDANERDILAEIASNPSRIVVSPIGRQGFIFGRGNQQISPRVLKAAGGDAVTVIATREKLRGIRVLRVDTGEEKLDSALRGPMKVLVDYGVFETMMVE